MTAADDQRSLRCLFGGRPEAAHVAISVVVLLATLSNVLVELSDSGRPEAAYCYLICRPSCVLLSDSSLVFMIHR